MFERHSVIVSVTQQFNTTTSIGRLTLKILLNFARFEREVIGERSAISSTPPSGRHVDGRLAATWP